MRTDHRAAQLGAKSCLHTAVASGWISGVDQSRSRARGPCAPGNASILLALLPVQRRGGSDRHSPASTSDRSTASLRPLTDSSQANQPPIPHGGAVQLWVERRWGSSWKDVLRTTLPAGSGLFLGSCAWPGFAAGRVLGLGLGANLEGPALQVPGLAVGLGFQMADV